MEHASDLNFIATLGLDWKLFLAQLINFTIVILILWKWVFGPIGKALEGRRKKIEESIKSAEEVARQRKEFEVFREERMRKVQIEMDALVNKTQGLAEEVRRKAQEEAKLEGEKILAEARRLIEADKLQILAEVREETVNLIVMATEKILREKMDDTKDKKLIEQTFRSLKT